MNAELVDRTRAHAIDHLEFVLDFGSEPAAQSQHGWVERFIKEQVWPLIEQAFDDCGGGADVLAIDRLEIDLGTSAGRGDEAVLTHRLRERLRIALADARDAASRRQSGSAIVPGDAAQLAALLRFLRSGRLQWNDTAAIEALAQQVARRDAGALESALLQAGEHAGAMRRRWAQQLGIDGLPELTRAWMVLEGALADARPGPWRQAWRTLLAARPAALRELLRGLARQARVRRRLLAMLSPGMRHELFALLVGARATGLQAVLAEAIRRRPGEEEALWACILEHLCLAPAGAPLPDAESLLAWAEAVEGGDDATRSQWATLFAGDTASRSGATWRVLWRNDRAGLRRLMRRRGAGRTMRGLLGAGAPPALRQQALELLAPSEGEAIGAFVAQACAWHARTSGGAQDGFDDWLWQQALGLLLQPGAAPSAASCFAALLQKIAERQRTSVRDVGLELHSGLQAAPQGLAASRQVLQILDGLAAPRGAASAPPAGGRVPAAANRERRIAVLCARLRRQVPLSIDEAAEWGAEARALLAQPDETLKQALRASLELPHVAARLATLLPATSLGDVLQMLRPRDHEQARRCVQLVVQACEDVEPAVRRRAEPLGWQFLMRELVTEGRRFAAAAMSGRFLDYLADKLRWTGRAGWRHGVRQAMARIAGNAPPALAREVAAGLDAPGTPVAIDAVDSGAAVHLPHAGLVLAAPYFERLFSMLGYSNGTDFVDEAAQARAVHLLHWLATGKEEAPEPALLLPKFLCGIGAAVPVARCVALLPREREAVDGLLAAMVAHWKVLGSTSVSGLRETFLQREGRLVRDKESWRLDVATGPYDMLLDHLPWGYGTVKLPWMAEVLHVQWR